MAPAPLSGVRVVEIEGIGPAPYAGMLLADLGADVVRIARPHAERGPLIADTGGAVLHRGRRRVTLDLKSEAGRGTAAALAARAHVLIEGLRPGAMERLGLGPEALMAGNPALLYCRITGWGQEGPMARTAGHDITYLALSGALGAMGPADAPPVPPLNLVADFGGGGMWAVVGILAGLQEAARTGRGRVIDAAMLDGAASQMALVLAWIGSGTWRGPRGRNLLDGGAPFYRCYACACGGHVAVGAIEPQFFAAMMRGIGLEPSAWDQADRSSWDAMAAAIGAAFARESRAHWAAVFDGTDACVAPVLAPDEAARHPHNAARGTFAASPGAPLAPAPGPRFDGAAPALPAPEESVAAAEILAAWGGAGP